MGTKKKKVSVRARKAAMSKKSRKKLLIALGIAAVAVIATIIILTIVVPNVGKKPASDVRKPRVAINIKDYGQITVELEPSQAPITVDNFLKLVNDGFYDGLTFHRIMEGFMMQGGDPEGTGMGGAEEQIKGEFSDNGVDNTLSHTRGTISMARSQPMDSASSQFFIMHADNKGLDGQYAAFGHVIEGMDVVDAVCTDSTAVVTDNNGTVPPESQPIITSIKVLE